MSKMLVDERAKLQQSFSEVKNAMKKRPCITDVVCYSDYGQHRSLAVAQLLREALVIQGWAVPPVQHNLDTLWARSCAPTCYACDPTAKDKRSLYNEAHQIFMSA